MHIQYLM